jgi:exodeoxyribonuclease VIII
MKNREPGIYPGIAFEEYVTIDAVNNSALQHMAKSAKHFYAKVLDPNREKDEPTPALILGNAVHTKILEPDEFSKRYFVVPEDAPKKPTAAQINAKKPSDETLEAIRYWTELMGLNAEKTLLTRDQWETSHKIHEAFMSSKTAQMIFSLGKTEQTLIWEDPIEGVLCKGRADYINDIGIIDIKSTIDARPDEFSRSAYNYGYATQAAFYVDGYKRLTGEESNFIFACFEKEPPYACRFYVASDAMIEFGRRLYRALLAQYAKAKKTGIWEGYPDELTTLELPPWAEKKNNQPPQEF